jgi:hypothetical protein
MNSTEPAYREDDEQAQGQAGTQARTQARTQAQTQAQRQPEPRSEEELEEMRARTAETVADARKEVDRAMATSHDQLLPSAESGVVGDYEDEEGTPTKDETRGAWPDWTEESGRKPAEPTEPADPDREQTVELPTEQLADQPEAAD